MNEFTNILIALGIGVLAGLIDALPMIRMKVPKFSILYVFAQWVFIGLVIPYINWDLDGWLTGAIIGTLGMVPIMIIAYSRNRKRVPTILLFAVILGAAIGWTSTYLIG